MTEASTTSVPQTSADPAPPTPPPRRPPMWTNPITLLGLVGVGVGLLSMITFWLIHFTSATARQNQYLSIAGFMILPGILVNGLVMCPVGIYLRMRKYKRTGSIGRISTRAAFVFLGVTFFLIIPVLGVAGYTGYHFTEASEFCGEICHNMEPQYVRYQHSPHARVQCAGCHIGPGASPFVKAKLSGLRQVAKTMTDSYPRPIPAAIAELRPAADTCEQCHWPSQFFGSKLKTTTHFAADERNTRHDYEVLIKVGGLSNHLGRAEGIHMHMLGAVEYVATDHDLQTIPWVRYTYPDGTKAVFRSDGKSGDEPPTSGPTSRSADAHGKPHPVEVRKLDCIDCHNLVGHDFVAPDKAVDHALSVGRLDATLPYIKREAVRVLALPQTEKPKALVQIDAELRRFYAEKYPEVARTRGKAVDGAVAAVQQIYKEQLFPDMKVDWQTYPNNIGHMDSPGCFRCHDGLHVSDTGKRISSDCSTCHTFLYRDAADRNAIRERTFIHPMKIHDHWEGLGPHEKMLCTDCHDGALGAVGWKPTATGYACGDCHPSGRWVEMRDSLRRRELLAVPTTRPR